MLSSRAGRTVTARFVWRTSSGSGFGPATAYKLTSAHETVNAVNVWDRDSSGTCVADGTSTGELAALEVVPAPPDGVGPLSIG